MIAIEAHGEHHASQTSRSTRELCKRGPHQHALVMYSAVYRAKRASRKRCLCAARHAPSAHVQGPLANANCTGADLANAQHMRYSFLWGAEDRISSEIAVDPAQKSRHM